MTAEAIKHELSRLANPEKAAFFPKFFKTGPGEYAEGDVFLGVTVPLQRKLARSHRDTPLEQVGELLHSKVHEHRFTGFLILVAQFEAAREASVRQRLFAFCREHLAGLNNWDLVDLVAPKLLGPYLAEHPELKPWLYELARSRVLWERRIAMLSTLDFIRRGDFTDTLRLAELLLEDEHDLMHKAVGWMLREMGERDLSRLEAFLDRHAPRMPRTMLRYAIEHFSPTRRKHYMQRPR